MAAVNSVNTNIAALLSLQNLNGINAQLDAVQTEISTGLRVNSAIDNASSFAIAQGIRGDIKSYQAVSQGIANGKGTANVALAGATSISDLLTDITANVTTGLDPGQTTLQQQILQSDFTNLVAQINQFISSAIFSGKNLLSSASANSSVLANISGATLTIRGNSQVTAAATILATQSVATTSNALVALTQVNAASATLAAVLSNLGADSRTITFQDDFISKVSDALEVGLGAIVDANLAKDSALLQALQVQQQLAIQSLSIANARPKALLGLFPAG
jgi:flagellin